MTEPIISPKLFPIHPSKILMTFFLIFLIIDSKYGYFSNFFHLSTPPLFIHHCKNTLSSLHILIHHCTFCAALTSSRIVPYHNTLELAFMGGRLTDMGRAIHPSSVDIIAHKCVICPKKGGRVEYVNTCMKELFIMFLHRVEPSQPLSRKITPCD